LRQREVEEVEEGEEEEEEDDEDEYPDEGRRLSSVEREAHEGRSLRDEDSGGQGSSAEEEGGSEVSD